MKLPESPFTAIDWSKVEPTRHEGTTGFALWRTVTMGDVRIRIVEYSPGYLADHWCDRGHVMLLLEGELTSELQDGREFPMTPGQGYKVSDFGDSPHRSKTGDKGAKLFIVD
ncbi:hypothetical protein EOD42_03690 [Rhodovarius crocodyli]|uniref:DHCW motif cupin fold protein n=1 Tax=Rhodovarius crocodyli TaxID=1979269 RepID=A0A437MNJ0_9PROT|nr:DHCW motif cupin fold protein [Rhodovarius crocodyli]RVT99213.1 hypothetical protein EOD42_03690 [Rhodovarius crocodyli]